MWARHQWTDQLLLELNEKLGVDAAGRQTAGSETYSGHLATGGPHQQGSDFSGTGSLAATYDAENHLLGKSYTSWDTCGTINLPRVTFPSFTTKYIYGANDHPVSIQGHVAYWDGDDLLLTMNNGAVEDVKVGREADIAGPSQSYAISVWDRDPTGTIVGSHDPSGYSQWFPLSTHTLACFSAALPPDNVPAQSAGFDGGFSSPFISEPKTDGYFDGDVSIQGARTYDPQSAQWTSPDAYAGDIHDPMSQKPFVWNRNNPVDYSDPDGFDPEDEMKAVQGRFFTAITSRAVTQAERNMLGAGYSRGEAARALGTRASDGIVRDVTQQTNAGEKLGTIPGTATDAEADAAGRTFVGEGSRPTRDGRGMVSKDGLRVYRYGATKATGKGKGLKQANFVTKNADGKQVSNIHVTIDNSK